MKQEYEMTQQEMDDIIAINKNMPPVMKFGDYWSGMDLTERINEYWKVLGEKYNFLPLTAEGSAKGNLFFLAEPKPIIKKAEDKYSKWPDEVRLKMIEKSNFYPACEQVYQYGFYDGYQLGLNCLPS